MYIAFVLFFLIIRFLSFFIHIYRALNNPTHYNPSIYWITLSYLEYEQPSILFKFLAPKIHDDDPNAPSANGHIISGSKNTTSTLLSRQTCRCGCGFGCCCVPSSISSKASYAPKKSQTLFGETNRRNGTGWHRHQNGALISRQLSVSLIPPSLSDSSFADLHRPSVCSFVFSPVLFRTESQVLVVLKNVSEIRSHSTRS